MLDKNNIPQHIAIIMDGNGRWAKARGFPRAAGHREGVERIRNIIDAANGLGIKVLTLFSFSSENWSRPKKEVALLMRYLKNFLSSEVKKLDKNNIRLKVIGAREPLSRDIQLKVKEAQDKTKDNSGMTLVLALNYGSRQEIVEAVKKFGASLLSGEATVEGLDSESFNQYLYTSGLPDPDLLIRTSGEMRISNFLLWQLSYAEFYFLNKHWPDFRKEDLEEAIAEYQKRERRFGRV